MKRTDKLLMGTLMWSAFALSACPPAEETNNQSGCPTGYAPGADGECADVDECATGAANCAAGETCANLQGSFECQPENTGCGDGFITKPNGLCVDINECDTDTDNCSPDAICSNLTGTFSCRCKSGFDGDGVTCTKGGCMPGYEPNAGGTCVDIDECAANTDDCAAEERCVNAQGSFSCVPVGACMPGFERNAAGSCVDIDECVAGTDNCTAEQTCINTQGAFTCRDGGSCQPGFEPDGAGACVDINECTAGTAGCSMDATCTNSSGIFRCDCKSGFNGDGFTCTQSDCQPGFERNASGSCVDINECLNPMACPAGETCNNNAGSFTCRAEPACQPGYERINGNCSEINECVKGTDNCDDNANCANSPGSFRCTCKAGYEGDGVTCMDIDECATGNRCGANGICANTPGSFSCSCQPGYKSTSPTTCADIDECNDASAGYTCDAICRNLPGSVECLSTVSNVNSPYWQYACPGVDDRLINNPTDFDMDCRCANQIGRPSSGSDPLYPLFDRCRPITNTSQPYYGTGPGVREWRRQLQADIGSTRYNGGFLDAAERKVYVGAQWSDNRAFGGDPELKNFGVVMTVDVNWGSPTVGNRQVISGKYLTANGDADVGTGPTLRAVLDIKRGADGMLYTYSDEAGILPQIMKIDPATGDRTLVWMEKEIYHPDPLPADQCENGGIVGQAGVTNGNRKSLQINFVTNAWTMSPTGEHYLSITQSGPARGPYGIVKISADGSSCEWVTRFAANSPNKYAEITNVAMRPADYGQPKGTGPRGAGLINFGANPVNLHWRPEPATGKNWIYVVNGPGTGGTGMKYYRIDAATGDRESLFSGILGDMFSIWDEARQILWTTGGFDATLIVPMNILGAGGMAPAALGGLKCLSTNSTWYQCMRGPGDTDRQNRGGLFLDTADGNFVMAHGSIGFIRIEVRTGNTYIFSM